ncbi:hypothetical protein [Streptomyces sp. TRM70350]|uniref:hypothetical protein n=1 Tax=Streptomyces sp. TRM70350 TaxID=2856165 RepID=UPI001C47D2F0|nr:hypothetical protein [Streptomyces sp. TRM70350]MBV7700203.1 hypothetical protein [Streptomyces sp. TRM70350]
MLDKASPLWWLFAALSAALFIALMLPGMVNRRQKVFVSCGPAVNFLALVGFSLASKESLNEWLPVYCAVLVGGALCAVGHWKAMRTFMTWKAENPGKPESEGPGTPWILQLAFTLPLLMIPAFLYVT